VRATGPTDRGSGPPGSRVACRCLSVGFDRQQIDVVVSPSCDLFCCIVHAKLIYVMDALLSHFFSSKVPWVLKQARVEVSFELQALLQKKSLQEISRCSCLCTTGRRDLSLACLGCRAIAF
jgi:hypothetical protein